ncbi:MAG: hypothetical protein L0Z70_00490 [Chloroflexi bacterium]|nr:hypothetical protein [Chloroflexota bacterium]
MDYGSILSRAWKITWKYKVLWIFGILAGCSSGGGGNGGGNMGAQYQRGDMPSQYMPFFDWFENIPDWQYAVLIGLAILVVLLLMALGIFLGTIGRVGLIRGVQQAEGGAERLTFGELFSGSMPYFWRVFGLNLLVGLGIMAFMILLVIVGIAGSVFTLGLGLLCIIPLICVLVPLLWFVGVVLEQANNAIVLENIGIGDGLKRGWEVARDNVGVMIVMALILILGVGLIGGLIIAMPLFLVVMPVAMGAMLGESSSFNTGMIIAAVCFVAYLPFLITFGGILTTFTQTSWTLTYMRLTKKEAALDLVEPGEATV